MNKNELITAIVKEVNITKDLAHRTLDAIIIIITKTLKKNEDVTLLGFGSFQVRQRDEREGRNPKTGEKMKIKASKSPIFKVGKLLKKEVNQYEEL